jgi:ATP-dependent protease ClpP protease subunit
MGGIIFASCKERYMFNSTSLLIHDGSMSLSGSSNKVKDLQKFYEKIDERVKKIIVENSSITSEEYDEHSDRELYLMANDCKEKGLCDYIVGQDCGFDEIL